MTLINIEELLDEEVRVKIEYDEYSYISGIVYKNEKELYINYFHVKYENRGNGIGSKLLKKIILVSINKYNINKVFLEDESQKYRKKNNIYIKFGFIYITKESKKMKLNINKKVLIELNI